MLGKLYVVGTPIGNLKDLSIRAIEAFKEVDFIAAEDTRIALKLFNYLNLKKKFFSYFEYNKYEKGKFICKKLLNGESCALISDAGMPCISDPGEYLVQMCIDSKIPVIVVPGPCAISSALSLAGTFGTRFTFEGFLSVNKKIRKNHLEQIKNELRTMVFYEAPHKLHRTLCDLYEYLGNRKIVLVKEITKIHESAEHTVLKKAITNYDGKKVYGEYVIVVKSKKHKDNEQVDGTNLEEASNFYKKYLALGFKKTEIAKIVSKKLKVSKNKVYKELLSKDEN